MKDTTTKPACDHAGYKVIRCANTVVFVCPCGHVWDVNYTVVRP
jgi:hypothetical protein